MARYALTLMAASLALAPALAWAEPLEDVTYRAVSLCMKIEAPSIDECSMQFKAGSSEHAAARMAVRQLYDARVKFMNECQASRSFTLCQYDVEARIEGGMGRAMFEAR